MRRKTMFVGAASLLGVLAASSGCASAPDAPAASAEVDSEEIGTTQQALTPAACKPYESWKFCKVQARYDLMSCMDFQKAADVACIEGVQQGVIVSIAQTALNFIAGQIPKLAPLVNSVLGKFTAGSGTVVWAIMKTAKGEMGKCRESKADFALCVLEAIPGVISDIVLNDVALAGVASLLRDRVAVLAVQLFAAATPAYQVVIASLLATAATALASYAGCKISNAIQVNSCEGTWKKDSDKCDSEAGVPSLGEPLTCNPNLIYCFDTTGCAGVGGGRTHGTGYARATSVTRINPSVIRAKTPSGESIVCNSWRNTQDQALGMNRCLTLRADATNVSGVQELFRMKYTGQPRKL